MLVAASWSGGEDAGCIVATLHGGRTIAALNISEGRWAACNAFLDEIFATPQEAKSKLNRLLRRGRRGYVGHVLKALDERHVQQYDAQASERRRD